MKAAGRRAVAASGSGRAVAASGSRRVVATWRLGVFAVVAPALLLAACGGGPSQEELAAVDSTPLAGDDWQLSTPEAQGLDATAVASLFHRAGQLASIHSLLVVKDGYLIAEDYFRTGRVDQPAKMQSVTRATSRRWSASRSSGAACPASING